MSRTGTRASCFAAAWESLPGRLSRPDPGLARLMDLSRADCPPPTTGRDWSPMHRAFWGLVEGGEAGLAQAKSAFLSEWRGGAALAATERGGNGIHYWNSSEFILGHRWICAAMLAQLLIVFDRLAALGAFSEEEIERIAQEAVTVTASHIAPHQRGRGHQPILHEPINQAAAMAAAQLWVGHLFGSKWRRWPEAREMWALGKQLLADNLGQQPRHGYDADGFTYLRLILPACHTLSIALLEDVEGGDWYHHEFAPCGTSLARLNSRILAMVGWSGLSWPLGRYGYLRVWNGFAAAFASQRSGDAIYSETMLADNGDHHWDSPWLGLELPLTMLWWPSHADRRSTPILPLDEVVPEAWWSGSLAARRIHVLSTWLRGKAPHLTVEVDGEPALVGGCESWPTANGVQPTGFSWDFSGWYVPGGRIMVAPRLPRLRGAVIDSTACYPPEAGVAAASRATVFLVESRLLIIDRWRAAYPARWQSLVPSDAAIDGAQARFKGVILAADRPWRTGDGREVVIDGERRPTRQLSLDGGEDDSFGVVLDWGGTASTPRWSHGVLRIGALAILPPGTGMRGIDGWHTDAAIAVHHADGSWSLSGVRRLRGGDGTNLWCSDPVDVEFDATGMHVHGLPYGGFATLRSPSRWLCLRRGNGLVIWARSAGCQSLAWDGAVEAGVMLNGVAVAAGQSRLEIQPASTAGSAPVDAIPVDHAGAIAALGRIRRSQDLRALPALRQMLTADAPRPHHPGMPLLSEATHLRAEAAATCAALGAAELADDLVSMLRMEATRDYDPTGSAWSRGFWGATARATALDAIVLLQIRSAVPMLDELRRREVVPHVQEAIDRAVRILTG
jgi:hypothetical protein